MMSCAASASADARRAQMSTFTPSRASARLEADSLASAGDESRFIDETEFHRSDSFQEFSARKRKTTCERGEALLKKLLGAIPRLSESCPIIFDRSNWRSGNEERCARLCGPSGRGYSTVAKAQRTRQATDGAGHGQPVGRKQNVDHASSSAGISRRSRYCRKQSRETCDRST